MNISGKLASSLNRRDEALNITLAKEIAEKENKEAVKELIHYLGDKNIAIQNDSIKVIYEIGAIKPELIAGYTSEFLTLLDSKNNRLQWGAMTALSSMASEAPELIFSALPKLIAAADKGSVITNDHCVAILIKLCGIKKYEASAFTLLNERLLKSPVNQLPMYAEDTLAVVHAKNKSLFIKTLQARLPELDKESKRKRIEKVLKKLH